MAKYITVSTLWLLQACFEPRFFLNVGRFFFEDCDVSDSMKGGRDLWVDPLGIAISFYQSLTVASVGGGVLNCMLFQPVDLSCLKAFTSSATC